ncbi:hypothetical protein CWE23_05165 [Idiomarina aquatica]|uniref:DUF6701 domain-containing protein n=1 Tax=Idiomarina aquatica TaxID=1327752 RepID=A0AA94EGG2_9GAMM|nr:hypothetical protein CWE23_05165 [Idiomarina aquatica]
MRCCRSLLTSLVLMTLPVIAADYGTQKNNVPSGCDQQGNGPVECPNGLTLQWGDTISATKATIINVTGNADLQNANISGGITINVDNGNLSTNSGFFTDGALNVSGTITFANNNTIAGNISAGTINASNGSNNNYQADVTVTNSFTGGFGTTIGGNLSGGDIITGSSTAISGSLSGDNITLAYQTTVAGDISANSLWTDSATDIGGSIQAGGITIGSASNVAGSISGSNFVQLAPSNSTFSGSVSSNGDIYIGSGNSVTGTISGNNITTDSPVIINGNISANGDFDLASGSQVNGDVNASNIVIRASNSEIDGTVVANGDIVIGSGSGIDGSASADSIEMQDSNAYITENAFADTLIDIGWGGSIGGDATAPTIINDSGDENAVAGGRYCDDSNSSVDPNDAFECQTGSGPADPGDDNGGNTDYTLSCQQLAELSQYGIVGSSRFTAGSGSVINNNDIDDEDGNTPTPQGTIDTVDLPYPPLDPSTFPTFSGGSDVTNGTNVSAGTYDVVRISGNNGQTTFAGGTYFIEELRFSTQNNSATLAPGTYYIGELNLGNNSSVNIAPEGQVKIYIRDGVNGGNDISFNNSGRTRDLIVYLYDNADFIIGNYCNSANNCPEFTFNGSIYSPYETVDIEFGQNTNYKGSALTQGTVSFGSNTEITYSEQDQRDSLEAQGCDPAILDDEPTSINHYRLSFPSSTVSCLAANVDVFACSNQPDNPVCGIVTEAETSITLNSSALGSSWGSGNSENISLVEGQASANLSWVSGGTTSISIANPSVSATNPFVCYSSGTQNSNCEIEFKTAGLIITATDGISDIAGQSAGSNFSTMLRAVETNTTTGACQAAISGQQTVKMGIEAINPTSFAGNAYTVSSSLDSQTLEPFNLGSVPANKENIVTTLQVNFDTNGEATLDNQYPDVGQLRLHAAVEVVGQSPNPSFILSGTSINNFVVKPFELRLTASNKQGQLAPGNADGFTAAAEAFEVTVQSLTESGELTDNFGNETTPYTLDFNLTSVVFPTQGVGENSLSKGAETDYGAEKTWESVSWPEVGNILLQPSLSDGNLTNDYLGAGDINNATLNRAAINVGRFYPDHFKLTSSSLSNTCTNFSYMGQSNIELNYTVAARNADNVTTKNYDNETRNYPVAEVLEGAYSMPQSGTNYTDLSSRWSSSGTVVWVDGELIYSSDNGVFERRLDDTPDGPYDELTVGLMIAADSEPHDRDFNAVDKTINGSAVPLSDTLDLRYGRTVLANLFGPANTDLSIVLTNQYYSENGRFITNTDDDCFEVSHDSSAVLTSAFDVTNDENITSGTAILEDGQLPADSFFLAAPASEGLYDLCFATEDYLTFDWGELPNSLDSGNAVCSDNDPRATANFGLYRGNDRVIYWLERW